MFVIIDLVKFRRLCLSLLKQWWQVALVNNWCGVLLWNVCDVNSREHCLACHKSKWSNVCLLGKDFRVWLLGRHRIYIIVNTAAAVIIMMSIIYFPNVAVYYLKERLSALWKISSKPVCQTAGKFSIKPIKTSHSLLPVQHYFVLWMVLSKTTTLECHFICLVSKMIQSQLSSTFRVHCRS